jgi:hypothetical protein
MAQLKASPGEGLANATDGLGADRDVGSHYVTIGWLVVNLSSPMKRAGVEPTLKTLKVSSQKAIHTTEERSDQADRG